MECFPKCHTCHQHFTLKGPAPNLLPCLHAVCETCVTSTAGGVISCSTCQREVNLTETHLQKDVVRQREIFHLTVQHRPSELLCTHEDDGNQAVCWCQECEEFLCEHCQNMHESFKATRKHSVQNVADSQPDISDLEEYCNAHKTYPLDLWDRDCRTLICARCRRNDHKDHDVVDIDVAAGTTRAEIESLEKEVQHVGVCHNSLLQTTRDQVKCTVETTNNLREKIGTTFNTLKVVLDQREKELLIELDQHRETTKSNLDSRTVASQRSYERCQMTTEYLHKALLYSSKYDILKIKTAIEETTAICLASKPPETHEELDLPVFTPNDMEKIKSALSSFGDIGTTTDLLSDCQLVQDMASQTDGDYMAALETIKQQHEKVRVLEKDLSASQSTMMTLTTQTEEAEKYAQDAHDQSKVLLNDKKTLEQEVSTLKWKIDSLETDMQGCSNTVKTLQQQMEKLAISPGATYHLLKTPVRDMSLILQCTHLKFDRDKVNIKEVHINTDGVLVNKTGRKNHGNITGRLVKYKGTTSTAPLPWCGSPQYWEVRGAVRIDETLIDDNLLLQTGLCVEEERDQRHSIARETHSYCLTVGHCPIHSSICRKVWRHGKCVLYLFDTLPNTRGQSTTLHYGVIFDDARCRVSFIDVTDNTVISTLKDADCSRPLWPMFGVYNPAGVSVSMSLVVGNDIDMTEAKKDLILKYLS